MIKKFSSLKLIKSKSWRDKTKFSNWILSFLKGQIMKSSTSSESKSYMLIKTGSKKSRFGFLMQSKYSKIRKLIGITLSPLFLQETLLLAWKSIIKFRLILRINLVLRKLERKVEMKKTLFLISTLLFNLEKFHKMLRYKSHHLDVKINRKIQIKIANWFQVLVL